MYPGDQIRFHDIEPSMMNFTEKFAEIQSQIDLSFVSPITKLYSESTLTLLYWLTSLGALVSNLIVIVVELYGSKSAPNVRKCLTSLAVSDIICGVLCVPIYIELLLGVWTLPPVLCPLSAFAVLLSGFVVSLTLTLFGIERYIATVYPISSAQHWLKSHPNLPLLFVWLISASYAAFITTRTSVQKRSLNLCSNETCGKECVKVHFYKCVTANSALLNHFNLVLTFVVPFMVLVFSNFSIIRKIKADEQHPIENSAKLERNKQNRKTIRMMFVVVLLYATCWMPIKLFHFLCAKFECQQFENITKYNIFLTVWILVDWLALAHSLVNPFVYSFMSASFRKDLKMVFNYFFCSKSKPVQNVNRTYEGNNIVMIPLRQITQSDDEGALKHFDDKENRKKKYLLLKNIIMLFVLIVLLIFIAIGLIRWNLNKNQNVSELELEKRRDFVKEMMLDSWNAYVRHAWGHETLKPVSKTYYSDYSRFDHRLGKNTGLSIVASMSTLWTMGLLDEFGMGREWIATKLDLTKMDRYVELSTVIVNYVGGLLSCYALTNDQMFLNKSYEIAQMTEPAFHTKTGLPFHEINFKYSKGADQIQTLSHLYAFHVDLNYLSDVTRDVKFRKQTQTIQNALNQFKGPENLYDSVMHINLHFKLDTSSLDSTSRELYISLLNLFIQSNGQEVRSIELYKQTLDAVEVAKMIHLSPGAMYYTRGFSYSSVQDSTDSMHYSSCYLGSLLSMGASVLQRMLNSSSLDECQKDREQKRINRHWMLASRITETCQQASVQTATGLGPALFHYDGQDVVPNTKLNYILSPELAQSNFILWRLTHNPKYRENAWQMAQSIYHHCRVVESDGGYSGIEDVTNVQTVKDDDQQAIFLSATLKYLYLTFTDNSVLSLDKWIFNSVGHPLPICGHNAAYPVEDCST